MNPHAPDQGPDRRGWGGALETVVAAARRRRGLHLLVIQLRFLIGFAFLPAGLKKILGQPFTAVENHGRFHDFLHAFRDTGGFYHSVGALQLVAAALLITQRFALLGALVALPILTAILALCWSTAGIPTTVVVTLMWGGTIGLVLWDVRKWRDVVSADHAALASTPLVVDAVAPVVHGLWAACGVAIIGLYLAMTVLAGEIYRPRGMEWSVPSFYLLVAMPLLPFATWIYERRRRAAHRATVQP